MIVLKKVHLSMLFTYFIRLTGSLIWFIATFFLYHLLRSNRHGYFGFDPGEFFRFVLAILILNLLLFTFLFQVRLFFKVQFKNMILFLTMLTLLGITSSELFSLGAEIDFVNTVCRISPDKEFSRPHFFNSGKDYLYSPGDGFITID